MPKRKSQGSNGEAAEAASAEAEVEKHVDATDEEQSSDDEAPEEVSAAAATALAGRRRKAEQQARQAAPAAKRKRARTSKGGRLASGEEEQEAGLGVARGEDALPSGGGGLELPSDLLLKVKSGGLQRMEADALAARRAEEDARDAESAASADAGRLSRRKAADAPRSDNFRLVVLDGDDGEAADSADGKAQASENANKFLRQRVDRQKRVSHNLFKARKRLGPSPDF